MKQFKPMLAGTCKDVDKLKFPLFVSPKLDGIRAIVIDGVVLSRSLKPIPNKQVQELFGKPEFEGLDGELIVGDWLSETVYNTSMHVMAQDADLKEYGGVSFFVFDCIDIPTLPYTVRLDHIKRIADSTENPFVGVIKQHLVQNVEELREFEETALADGFEGVMVRATHGEYKFGRSTEKQGWLLKVKRFKDSEAEILGFVPLMESFQGGKINELGYKETSNKKSDKKETEKIGSLAVKDLQTGVEFEIGSGFTQQEREQLWLERDSLPGKIVKYKYFDVGVIEKPRFPVYIGFRSELDM